MATVHKQRNVWCNNYRVRPEYVSDSDSDSGCVSDVAADAVAKADSSDARLMREMDLSGRHETVEYHPNPWSIARINAVSRSSLAKPTPTARTPGPAPSLPKPQSKPIVEAFKKEAKRGPREGQPIVRNVSNPGDRFVDESCTTKHDDPSAKKSRQCCERTQTTHLAQVRACPQPTELLHPPSPVHNPQTGSATRGVTVLEKEESAHISTLSNRFIQSARVPPPFKPRRIIGAHRAARSSPVRLVAPQSTPDARHAVRDRPMFHHSSPGPRSHVPVTAHIMRPPLPPLVSLPGCTNSRPTRITNDLSPAFPLPHVPGNTDQGMVPSWLLDALDDGIYVSPPRPLVSEPRQDATKSPHIGTPEPKHKRLASPRPATPRKKPRARASASWPPAPAPPAISASRGCPAAYTFGEDDDLDAEWSTLAGTKRRPAMSAKRAGKPGGVKQSGCFRLPGLALRTPTRAPEAKRRIITYIPPPMASKKRGNEVTANIDPPTRGTRKHAQVASEEQEEEEIEIRVMNSDVTLVNEDEEHVAGIDVDDICMHYHTTRACMKAESRMRRALGCIIELRV